MNKTKLLRIIFAILFCCAAFVGYRYKEVQNDFFFSYFCVLAALTFIVGAWINDLTGVIRTYDPMWGRRFERNKHPKRFFIENTIRKILGYTLLVIGVGVYISII